MDRTKAAPSAAAVVAAVLLGAAIAAAQPVLRLQWELAHDRSGRPVISGYVYNNYGIWARNIRLLVEQLDAAGQPVGRTIGYVDNPVPAMGRSYFEVRVPVAGATYRVTVLSVDWIEQQEGMG